MLSIRKITTLLLLALSFSALGQEAVTVSICDSISRFGNIRLQQPEALAKLLVFTHNPGSDDESAADQAQGTANTRTGYRVQVFDDNNPHTARSQAESAARKVSAEFPHLRCYTSFNSPYWRVKAGDFRTRAEAESAMEEIRQAFPALNVYLRVVRDRINQN